VLRDKRVRLVLQASPVRQVLPVLQDKQVRLVLRVLLAFRV
jgi:hypothetical protein